MADRSKKDVGVGADGAGGGGFNWVADASNSLERHDPAKAERRRGRPKGASNKKTADFAAWYAEKGFKDPLELMAEFMSADPVALQAFFAEHERTKKAIGKEFGIAVPSLSEIVEEQLSCAEKIAPYLHGKAPTRIEVTDERLPVLVVNLADNQLDQAKRIAVSRGLSVGSPLTIDANKNNDLANEPMPSLTGKSLMDGISK